MANCKNCGTFFADKKGKLFCKSSCRSSFSAKNKNRQLTPIDAKNGSQPFANGLNGTEYWRNKVDELKEKIHDLKREIDKKDFELKLQEKELTKENVLEKALQNDNITSGLMGLLGGGNNGNQGLTGTNELVKKIEESPNLETVINIILKGLNEKGQPFMDDLTTVFKTHNLV